MICVNKRKEEISMQFEYKTKGTCSQYINFEIEDGKLKNVQYIGGCNGNLKGISSLVEGMDIDEVIARLEGTTCGMKNTSCPDQLATALKEAKAKL
ncbi:MAG: TIGR03905 family TSCPD domain-containing protein [Oscillospiraceae bacterium]|nr:TIGR03905 family TSCPD domain-containing protein [Oscillospiraceae bacterium]